MALDNKIHRFLQKYYPAIIISSIILFYALNNYAWLKINELPPFAGEAYYLLRSLDYFDILTHPPKHLLAALINADNLRPPIPAFSMAVLNIVFGKSRLVSAMVNIFFIGILFSSTYYFGKKIQDKKTGILAVFILSMYPFVFGLSRITRSNIASMAFACLSLYFLLCTERFKRIQPCIMLGIFLGLGILTSTTFVCSVIIPIVVMLIAGLSSAGSPSARKQVFFNSFLTAIIAILIGGIWYFYKIPFLLDNYTHLAYSGKIPLIIAPPLFSSESCLFYFRVLINGQITPIFAILFFVGLFALFKKKKINLLLLSWIIGTYLIFTFIKLKEFKETSDYLPAFALITAAGVLNLGKEWLRRYLIYAIVFLGLFQYFMISYTKPYFAGIRVSFFKGRLASGFNVPSYIYPINEVFFHYPRKGDWKIDKIITALQKENPACRTSIAIGVTDAHMETKTEWFDPFNFKPNSWMENFIATNADAVNYSLRTHGLPYSVINLSTWGQDWRKFPLLDFIISVNKIDEFIPLISQEYRLILQTEAPDSSPIYVYKKKSA